MAAILDLIDQHKQGKAPLLPVLHAIQQDFGWISEEAIIAVAKALNLSRADVYGVVSYYHDFREEKIDKPILKVCRAEACQARGVEAILADTQAASEGKIELESVYCLGLCAVGPAALSEDGHVHARLDTARLTALIERLT